MKSNFLFRVFLGLALLTPVFFEGAKWLQHRSDTTVSLRNLLEERAEEGQALPYFLRFAPGGQAREWNNYLLFPDTSFDEKIFVQLTPSGWYLVERNGLRYSYDLLLSRQGDYAVTPGESKRYDVRIPGAWKKRNTFSLNECAAIQVVQVRQEMFAAILAFALMLFFLLLAFVVAIKQPGPHSFQNKSNLIQWLLAAMVIRLLLFLRLVLLPVFEFEIFDPSVYASSYFLPSLGDLILHLFLAVGVFSILQQFRAGFIKRIPLFVRAFVLVLLLDMVIGVVAGLVMDSNISFDLHNFFSLNYLSLLALLCAGLMMFMVIRLFSGLGFYSAEKETTSFKVHLLHWILGTGLFLLFQYAEAGRGPKEFVFSVSSAWIILGLFGIAGYLQLQTRISALVLSALLSAVCLHQAQLAHEKEYLRIFASRLTSSHDVESEYIFRNIENKLAEEFLQPADYDNYDQRKEGFESRIRQLYFSGYLDKFEVLFFTFDSSGKNTNKNEQYPRDFLNRTYNFETFPSLSNYFYRIKNPAPINGYIAKFENCDLKGSFGETFIILQPKFFQRSYYYPPFLAHRENTGPFDMNQYAYAVYASGKLVRQKGDYSYALEYDAESLGQPGWAKGFHHFVSKESQQTIVVISKDFSKVSLLLSLISLMLLLLLIIAAILFIITLFNGWPLKNEIKTSDRQMELLSTRIRIALVVMALAGLLLSVVFNINYSTRQNEDRERNLLSTKLRDVSLQLQNVSDLDGKLGDKERIQLLINEISEAQKTDLNLFDTSGLLLAGSKPQIFEDQFVAPLMHPDALRELRGRNLSQFLQNEQVGGHTFVSAYLPFFNANRDLIAYINVPFFSESNAIRRELSSYITTLINIYVLLILFSLAIASFISKRITEPLRLLKEKISGITLGGSNELIEWKHNDEIGDLVREYNAALQKLDQSARLIAESEREGAWKEMAKQVAHEIKNPLTPMKLNIQHLQRAWKDGHPQLEEMFAKVTRILIEQIDGLSTLATEFSNFAKMPVENMTECDMAKVVDQAVHLFDNTEGVTLFCEIEEKPAMVFADPEQLSRVFTNLIKNAVQAIPADRNGRIEVRLKRLARKKCWLVEVKDNGNGIPEGLRDKIFIPNFSTKTSGMGLGLAISKKIIENSKGNIWFDTGMHGTSFYVEIPVFEAQ